jgi:hypothetical protein
MRWITSLSRESLGFDFDRWLHRAVVVTAGVNVSNFPRMTWSVQRMSHSRASESRGAP